MRILKIDKNSIYFKAVIDSTVVFKIKTAAASLFDIWAEQARQQYPEFSFQANNETTENDLIVALAKSIESVWRSEHQIKRNISGWSGEFVLDSASSILNTRWSQEYIFSQTQEYQDLCFLKSLTQYLKIEGHAIKKIEALYNHLVNKKTNVAEEDLGKNEKIVDLAQFKKNKHPDKAFQNRIINYLDTIFFEKHFLLFRDILKNKGTFVLSDFFNINEINELIENIKWPQKQL